MILHIVFEGFMSFWLVLRPTKMCDLTVGGRCSTRFEAVRQRSTAFDSVRRCGTSNGEGRKGAGGRRKPYVFLIRNSFEDLRRTKTTRPSSLVNRGRADLGRLRRVTARPLNFDSIGVAEIS